MNHTQEVTILGLYHTIRRTIRVLERLEEVVKEDDLKRKLSRFTTEHVALLDSLKDLLDMDEQMVQATPQAIIQFPINREELLEVAAKSEKQVVEDVKKTITAKVDPEATKILKQHKPKLLASYDYIQALHDLLA